MSCEFTPQPPGQAQQPDVTAKPYWLSAAEVEDQEHAELDADGLQLLAWALALMGGVAAVAFTLGYVSASMGLL